MKHTTSRANERTMLEVKNLRTQFFTDKGKVNAVDRVSFDIKRNEMYGIVGESGSGKSVTAQSILDIVESPGRITNGEIWYHNSELADLLSDEYPTSINGNSINLLELPPNIRQIVRGKYFGIIFQDPKESFNKSYTVGEQIAESVEIKRRIESQLDDISNCDYSLVDLIRDKLSIRKKFISNESYDRAIELLELVGMPDPIERADEYPYQFSGGMLQRGMIAQALASDPDLLIADEPTTALDVTIQSQIIEILKELSAERGMSVLLITHNLGVVARTCDRVGVMYAGELVEKGPMYDVFKNPAHPYTVGLLKSAPDTTAGGKRLDPIPGSVPDLIDENMPTGCHFIDRCPHAMDECSSDPPHYSISEDHLSKCFLADSDSEHESEIKTITDTT